MATVIPQTQTSKEDLDAIEAAALDYLFGWVDGDPDRHAKAYHPEALKRRYFSEGGVDQLNWVTPQLMVDWAASGQSREENTEYELFIDDVTEGMASVRVYSTKWIDFLHVVKARGEWRILNVTWKHNLANPDRDNDPL